MGPPGSGFVVPARNQPPMRFFPPSVAAVFESRAEKENRKSSLSIFHSIFHFPISKAAEKGERHHHGGVSVSTCSARLPAWKRRNVMSRRRFPKFLSPDWLVTTMDRSKPFNSQVSQSPVAAHRASTTKLSPAKNRSSNNEKKRPFTPT